jgi:hypothetical protein
MGNDSSHTSFYSIALDGEFLDSIEAKSKYTKKFILVHDHQAKSEKNYKLPHPNTSFFSMVSPTYLIFAIRWLTKQRIATKRKKIQRVIIISEELLEENRGT